MIAPETLSPSAIQPGGADRKPSILIRKVAVLGAGTMGSRIAAHMANAGLPVVLLDIPAAAPSLDALKKSKPAAFFDPSLASHITIGNFDDDLALLASCDWVIEAVTEDLAIKQSLIEKIAPHLKPDVILTTNTSGIPIASIAAKMPEHLRKRCFGAHFFNPPRYMRLVEIIATPETDPQPSGGIPSATSDSARRSSSPATRRISSPTASASLSCSSRPPDAAGRPHH